LSGADTYVAEPINWAKRSLNWTPTIEEKLSRSGEPSDVAQTLNRRAPLRVVDPKVSIELGLQALARHQRIFYVQGDDPLDAQTIGSRVSFKTLIARRNTRMRTYSLFSILELRKSVPPD
jgi:hypothetical protein